MSNINRIDQFKFWSHKVLPLTYDESLSYYEFLCKVLDSLNRVIDTTNALIEKVEQDEGEIEEIRNYVNQSLEEIRSEISEFEGNVNTSLQTQYNNFVNLLETFEATVIAKLDEMDDDIEEFTTQFNEAIEALTNSIEEDANLIQLTFSGINFNLISKNDYEYGKKINESTYTLENDSNYYVIKKINLTGLDGDAYCVGKSESQSGSIYVTAWYYSGTISTSRYIGNQTINIKNPTRLNIPDGAKYVYLVVPKAVDYIALVDVNKFMERYNIPDNLDYRTGTSNYGNGTYIETIYSKDNDNTINLSKRTNEDHNTVDKMFGYKNLLDANQLTDKTLNNSGEVISQIGYTTSDYIPVVSGDKIAKINYETGAIVAGIQNNCFYDINHNFVSQYLLNNEISTRGYLRLTDVTPALDNCVYVNIKDYTVTNGIVVGWKKYYNPVNGYCVGEIVEKIKADINTIENEITSIESDIANMGNSITTLQTDVNSINTDIRTINDNIQRLNGDIGSINTNLSDLSNEMISEIGVITDTIDDITTAIQNVTPNVRHPWYDRKVKWYSMSGSAYITTLLTELNGINAYLMFGCGEYTMGINSGKIVEFSGNTLIPSDIYNTILNDIDHNIHSPSEIPDIVVIECNWLDSIKGTHDNLLGTFYDATPTTSTYLGCIQILINTLTEADILPVFLLQTNRIMTSNSLELEAWEGVKNICENNGVPYLKCFKDVPYKTEGYISVAEKLAYNFYKQTSLITK